MFGSLVIDISMFSSQFSASETQYILVHFHVACRNLLLPKRMPSERPWAKFVLKIFRAEGLPSMNSGFMGKIMRDKKVFLDPYVQVTFAGQQVIFFQFNFELDILF